MPIIFQTHFAPPQRLDVKELVGLPDKIARMQAFEWLERVPIMVFLTNPFRQIVYCNQPFRKMVRPELQEGIFGLRPGEVLGCVHAHEMDGGCGCARSCRHCGAALAILKSLQGEELCKECHLQITDGKSLRSLDLQILSRPFWIDDELYSLNTAFDISHERKVFAQNRTFLHNMINAAGGMEVLLEMLQSEDNKDEVPLSKLHQCTLSMLHEVLCQYDSVAAEAGKLVVNSRQFDLRVLINGLIDQIRHHALGHGRILEMTGPSCTITTDPRLLRHILGNLLINALEAAGVDDKVTISWEATRKGAVVHVDNPGFISEETRARLFRETFSTKGVERGLGLYMAHTIAEKYLNARLECAQIESVVRFSIYLG